jgi:hypothetical protein
VYCLFAPNQFCMTVSAIVKFCVNDWWVLLYRYLHLTAIQIRSVIFSCTPVVNLASKGWSHWKYNRPVLVSLDCQLFISTGVGETMSLNCGPPAGLLFIPQTIYEYGATVKWHIQGKTEKLGEKNLFQCHHKSHMDWPGHKPEPPRWKAGDYHLSYGQK